jgi:subtilisin-like proprotein convertase family protein
MTRRLSLAGISVLAALALLGVVGSPAQAKTKTKTATFSQCLNSGALIPDRGANSALINVPVPKNGKKVQTGVVSSVQTGVRITHADVFDLNLTLVSPGGKAVALASEEGGFDRTGYGSGAANCSGSLVTFGDAFPTPIKDIPPDPGQPITGQYLPEQPLAAFNGGPARGPWVLLVADCCTDDLGVIDGFSLNLTYTYKATVKKKKKGKK